MGGARCEVTRSRCQSSHESGWLPCVGDQFARKPQPPYGMRVGRGSEGCDGRLGDEPAGTVRVAHQHEFFLGACECDVGQAPFVFECCIVCRLPAEEEPSFTCSTGSVGETVRVDASLPFLSASAGLMLLADIIRLQMGNLTEPAENFTSLNLGAPEPLTHKWPF